mmetsp:Transcript_21273/g.62854  ORF Transcript_21273/g.62854 Transcript_21273/m.62854 type:complete len:212 (+) Transcript_21273:100-735(+)
MPQAPQPFDRGVTCPPARAIGPVRCRLAGQPAASPRPRTTRPGGCRLVVFVDPDDRLGQLLDVLFDLRELRLVLLLPLDFADGVEAGEAKGARLLVLRVDRVPLLLEVEDERVLLLVAHEAHALGRGGRLRLRHGPHVLVLVLDLLFDVHQVLWDLAEARLLLPVHGRRRLLGLAQDVFDRIGLDEVLWRRVQRLLGQLFRLGQARAPPHG